MKHTPFDKLSLALVAAAVSVLALLNLFQTERPTVSEIEQRELATMPDFSVSSVLNGSYFTDTAAFFSDTFFSRDAMVDLSKKMDRLKSLSLIHEREFTVIMDPNATAHQTVPPLDTLPPLPTDPSNPTTVPTLPLVTPVSLNTESCSVAAGATCTVAAIIGDGYSDLRWSTSDESIAFVTDNGDGTATVKGMAVGTAEITATVSDGQQTKSAACKITVTSAVNPPPDEVADFLPSGIIIYKGAAYTQSYFVAQYAPRFADVYERFAKLFPDTRVTVMPAPLATITITDPKVSSKLSSQGYILDSMEASVKDKDGVNFINLKNIFKAHADEYLFFKSDHHWTQRGAYYAYYEFAQSVGLTPRPINDFEVRTLTTKWIGSMWTYTRDERVKSFYDTVEAFMPRKPLTMTVHTTNYGTYVRDFCINMNFPNYLAFIDGDNGFTVINVPDNPQDMSILVIKDSYGNAFVPFLTEHYGNIYVVDPRHTTMNLLEQFKDTHLTDIVFMSNNQSGNNAAWYKYYCKLIGVNS